MNIYSSAVQQLTIWYVGALFIVCMLFSLPTYVITSNRLERGAVKQTEIIQRFNGRVLVSPNLNSLRDQQIKSDQRQLLYTLIVANVAVLSIGAYLSHNFAKRTLKPLEDAHAAQARFTTDASHELRTPLATMQTEIEVTLRDKKFNANHARSILASNLEEIARLRALSEQLLGLARLDSGQLQKAKLQLGKIIKDEITNLEKRHGIKIDTSIDKVPSIKGDEQLVRQLVSILVDNAVKYAGDKAPDIGVRLSGNDSDAELIVTDNGIGIKASELPHIFDRFYRGSNASKYSTDGHGLGLSLAKQIVDAHGGRLNATSQPGKQTTFEITLPS